MKRIVIASIALLLATGSAHAQTLIETLGNAATQSKLNAHGGLSASHTMGTVKRKLASSSKSNCSWTDPEGPSRSAGKGGGSGRGWQTASSGSKGKGGGWATAGSRTPRRR